MRFPLALSAKIAGHIIKHRLKRTPKFAMVLQLEPLHTCNLTCTGCGRIREYSTSLKDMMSLEDCLGSAAECDAPMVSICGGEPLIYPKIEALIEGILEQGRIVYVCTNGMFMRRKMRDYLAAVYAPTLEPTLEELLTEGLITEKEAENIREGDHSGKPVIRPSEWMYWNVHVDGLEYTHDLIVEREGVFKECVLAIRMAKILGYQVATNTTVYKETDMAEVEQMFQYFSAMEVDGHTISPGYDYDAAKKDMVKRLGKDPEEFFLTREMTREKFANIEEWGQRFTIFGTPVYQEFLAGKRELTCTAWAIPTRNIAGWKAPCYLMTDVTKTKGHYPTYAEMLEDVDWESFGVVDGEARDPRCENCMVHCGYDPSGALGTCYESGDNWKNFKYNFGARPAIDKAGLQVEAHNGCTIGNGHLAEAKAAIQTEEECCDSKPKPAEETAEA
ncbi:MAG: hopanoid biosynthesis associated radical SAM protein HpnH [Verrucomicrobiales bacterium]|nr:hopanoid biosynthesis associated radical SAM protein HpnH [Verrucomicrobiales bacterium]MBL69124.1 hopanoid biosynthesis associated radical SAM protein HpnH [Verrucomicrobiales bacterium]|tara:strand:- start:11454 stop:12791 length:1338 start_codon:yes stop_codon:yes gene_type:complete